METFRIKIHHNLSHKNIGIHESKKWQIDSCEVPKNWIDKNEPIAIAISIFTNFMSINSKKTGKIGMPSNNDKFIGGHAVIICGYDDNTSELILRNSWGTYWGDNGYFYFPCLMS